MANKIPEDAAPAMTASTVPVPDPTKLTTDAVTAATTQWRRDLFSLREIIEARLDAMDHATTLRLAAIADMPTALSREIDHLQRLHNEKFTTVDRQFAERDIRAEQASKASTEALAAALQAAKELVGAQGEASAAAAVKSETSFTKQIDQIGTIISTLEKSLDARITELKERIDRGEGNSTGVTQNSQWNREVLSDQRSGSQLMTARIYGATGVILGIIAVATTILIAITR